MADGWQSNGAFAGFRETLDSVKTMTHDPARTCTVRIDPPLPAAWESPARKTPPQFLVDPSDPPPERESLRVLVIGSRRGVTGTIQTLYRLGFAEMVEWSPLLPAPTPGEVMSILTRYVLAD